MRGAVEYSVAWLEDPDHTGPTTSNARGCGARSSLAPSPRRKGRKVSRDPRLRVLILFEDEYRSYREAIAAAIRGLRPRVEVTVAEPGTLGAEVARTEAHLVIGSRPGADDTLAWVRIPHDPESPTTVCLEGRCSETGNPTLDDLLSIVDAVERLARSGSNP